MPRGDCFIKSLWEVHSSDGHFIVFSSTTASSRMLVILLLYQIAMFNRKINGTSLYMWHMVLLKGLSQML